MDAKHQAVDPCGFRSWRARQIAVILVLLVGLPMTHGVSAQATASKTSFDRLYREYAAGDHAVLVRAVRTGEDLQHLRPPRDDKGMRQWLGGWDRTRAAFLLELASVEAQVLAPFQATVAAGRLYVTNRPRALGIDASEDAFETAWHKNAIGLLQDGIYAQAQETYFDVLDRRYAQTASNRPLRFDPRFALDRGIAQEQRCVGLDARQHDDCLRKAVVRYAVATTAPETRDEANVRAAWVQFQLGEPADALRTIDRARPGNDRDLIYWSHLFRGRMLEAVGRTGDAEGEYRMALDTCPHAQSAGVALAMTLFTLGRPDEAAETARAVRQQPRDAVDPWWTYLHGDARFLTQWRTELRSRITP